MITTQAQLRTLITVISSLQARKFYGAVQLDLIAGNVVLTRVSETIKLEEVYASQKSTQSEAEEVR